MAYAGIGLRLVATIIDSVVLVIVFWIVAAATGNTSADGFQMEGAVSLIPMLLSVLYYVLMEGMSGATLGKMAVGLRVARTDGTSPVGIGPALIRTVLRIVDGFFFYIVGAIFVMTSPTKQRLGDRVAGTVVVRKSSVTSPVAA